MGAGLELLISCDYVMADSSFKSGLPEMLFNFPNIMIPPETMGKYISRAGVSALATGSTFNLESSLALGIVDKKGTLKEAEQFAVSMNNEFFSRTKQYYMMDQKEIRNYVQYIKSLDTHNLKLKDLENYRNTHFS
jgi:Enoyl-CoA hydratase/carnithine racemase